MVNTLAKETVDVWIFYQITDSKYTLYSQVRYLSKEWVAVGINLKIILFKIVHF